MSEKKMVWLHGYLNDGAVSYCRKDNLETEMEMKPRTSFSDGWECFSDGIIEYRRQVEAIDDDVYKISNVWENISEEAQEIRPLFRAHAVDRFLHVEIPLKNGKKIVPELTYSVLPEIPESSTLRYPGASADYSLRQAMCVFCDDSSSSGYITTDWEFVARHWVIFPLRTMKAKETFSATTYVVLNGPDENHGPIEDLYKVVEEILNK